MWRTAGTLVEFICGYFCYKPVEHKELEDHGHDDGEVEPAVVRILAPNEILAEEMKGHGIDCSPVLTGSHELELEQYYSHLFALSPHLVTNRGLVKLHGRKVDYVQVLQRN